MSKASVRLALKSREDFASLSLHEKNAYLQDVAREVSETRGQAFEPLTKDALSRLRRYYSRRSMADLRLEEMPDDGIRDALRSLASAIRAEEVGRVLQHELPASPPAARRISREPPIDDAQLMFFVPSVHDAPIKDDFNLMDIAPFALSKSSVEGVIRYELKDCIITVEGGALVGLATAYDYDIVINMISHLCDAMPEYQIEEKKGLRPHLPPRLYQPHAAEILKFCRRELGGKQYEDLERALDRLPSRGVQVRMLSTEAASDAWLVALGRAQSRVA